MTRAGNDPVAGATAGSRELEVEGLIGVVALFFLVKYANGGINGYWWACLAIFGVGLVSWLRDLRRAWTKRKGQVRSQDLRHSMSAPPATLGRLPEAVGAACKDQEHAFPEEERQAPEASG